MRMLSLVVAVTGFVVACSSKTSSSSAITFTTSGETTALSGFAFPPASADDEAFVDGWQVEFERVLVTIDEVELTDNPDLSPTDQALTGAPVARARGPWAVNLSVAGKVETPPLGTASSVGLLRPADVGATVGRGSSEDQSIRLVRLEDQNLHGGDAFDPAVRYGVGYRVIAANAGAKRVNLDADASKDYEEMIAKGWSTLYVGTATFRGGADCRSSDPTYDYTKLPTIVRFRLGFATPVTYANCQNTDLKGQAFAGEEAKRGVQVDGPTFAQLTFHLEHAFWDTVDHDQAKPFFDPMAASARGGVVTVEDLAAQDPSGFVDADGKPLPWRSCLAAVAAKPGQHKVDTGSVALVGKNGDPAKGLRSYADYVAYQQSTMGHLNADGLCAIARAYPSPR